jgi:hypothetical protein
MKKETKTRILQTIKDTTNDIIEYLVSDVPMECHQKDINYKMSQMRAEIKALLDSE